MLTTPTHKKLLLAAAISAATGTIQAGQLEEVVVTAERKESNLQRTPIAVSVISEADMERLQITAVGDIDVSVPGMKIDSNIASSSALTVAMRGASENNAAFVFSESGVGLYMNGVYRRLSAGDIELADIERIEVLRGPQGTLFGRNTLAGAINIVTRRPSQETTGSLSISYDEYETIYVKGAISGGLSDSIAGSLSVVVKDRGKGAFTNLYNGEDVGEESFDGIQGSLTWDLGNGADLFVSAYSTESDSDGLYGSPRSRATGEFVAESTDVFGAPALGRTQLPFNVADQSGIHAIFSTPLSEEITFKYITSYQDTDTNWGIDFTAGGFASGCAPASCHSTFFRQSEADAKQFSHELQLLGTSDSLDWIVGVYYFEEDTVQRVSDNFDFFGFIFNPPASNYALDSSSTAAFGQITYQISDALAATAGGRYTEDKKDFQGNTSFTPFAAKPDWDELTGKVGIDYQINDDMMVYASWSQGFKSGTFDPFASAPLIETPLNAELVDSYELGFKGTFLDNSLRLNTALFRAEYADLVIGGTTGSGLFTANGGETDIQGLELEATWAATEALTLNLVASALFDREWDKIDVPGATISVGDELQYTQDLQWTLGATYVWSLGESGNLTMNFSASFFDEYYPTSTHGNDPINLINDRTTYNLGLVYNSADERHRVWLNGKNITNEKDYYSFANFGFVGGGTINNYPTDPSTIEVGYRYAF